MSRLLAIPRAALLADVTAGLIVGVVALPLCIAFAIASGVSPEKGIFAAVIGSALIALLSGCKVQIGGPSGPFVVLALGIVSQYGLGALAVATFMAGIILILMGRFGFGSLIKFIPYPVTTGFATGVAILLVTGELPDLLGLPVSVSGGNVLHKWVTAFSALGSLNPYAVAISAVTVLLQLTGFRPLGKIPGSLIALVVTTAAVHFLQLPVETIGSRFPDLPSAIPPPIFPDLSFDLLRMMVSPAIAIALLAAMESLLSAVVADGITGQVHEPNRVLTAQGFANLGSALFGCLPVTSAIARTATNVRNGATTAVSGLSHALFLLLVLLAFGRWASLIPLAALAATLVVVAFHLFDWRALIAQFRGPKGDIAVLLATLGLTVLVDLATGIQIGIALAGALFIKRMSAVTGVNVITRELDRDKQTRVPHAASPLPKGVEVYEINGPFFFGAVYKLREALQVVRKSPRVRIIRMEKVNAIDSTGLHALEELWKLSRKQGAALLISEIHAQPFVALSKSTVMARIGEENVLASFDEALTRAHSIVAAQGSSAPARRADE